MELFFIVKMDVDFFVDIDEYFEILPKQDSLKNRLQLIKNSIYEENKPTQLKWRLVKNMKRNSNQKM